MTPPADLLRFERPVRWVHRSVAFSMTVCITTAAILYLPQLQTLVNHRHLVEQVHVISGYAVPVPILAGLVSRVYRRELGRLNRFVPADWRWLRSRKRRDGHIRVGKFNAGQKLNACLSAAGILVLLGTGTLMYFTRLAPLMLRTGSTFVHDWTALAVGLLFVGHVAYALRDDVARRGMRTGRVPRSWVDQHHAAWLDEPTSP